MYYMFQMVSKRLYILTVEKYTPNCGMNPDVREYLYSNLEYATYEGLDRLLNKYFEVNHINIMEFKDLDGRTYEEILNKRKCRIPMSNSDPEEYYIEMSIVSYKLVDDEFMEDWMTEFMKKED
jgi:D-hexose-6-phosphate mutarotase